eukprot:scaffold29282_cov68-Phaeocystis_antarctica.AAC.2
MSSTDVASPVAAVLERRPSRTTQEKRKQPCGDSESEGPRQPREKSCISTGVRPVQLLAQLKLHHDVYSRQNLETVLVHILVHMP